MLKVSSTDQSPKTEAWPFMKYQKERKRKKKLRGTSSISSAFVYGKHKSLKKKERVRKSLKIISKFFTFYLHTPSPL